MKLSTPKRITVHAILIAGSIIFLFPFVWLATTSVKPIEQTMKMPPDWLPRAYYAPVQGERLKIVRERQLDGPFVIVRVAEGRRKGERVLLPAAKYQDGRAELEIRVADRTLVTKAQAARIKEVAKGFWLVREKIERLPQEKPPSLLAPDDILDWPAFCSKLSTQGTQEQPGPGKRIWQLLPAGARRAIDDAARKGAPEEDSRAKILKALNQILERRDLFQHAAAAGLDVADEARELLRRDRAALSTDEVLRLNRLLLEAACPREIVTSRKERLTPRWDCVAPEEIGERTQPAWWNYEGAIRYTGYHEVAILGARLRVPMFLVYLYNTLVVAVLGVIGVTLSSALAAYGFARIRWRGRDTCFIVTLSTMMIPFAVTMVPLYGVFRTLGWIGTLRPLWVPAFFGSAFNIFLLRQFFRTIPQDLSDAARIDGCSEFGIFWRIVLPLSKPALAVVALFHFMYAWKDFMGPLIYLTKQETYTLSLGLQFYQSQHGGSEWHYLMAASTLMILPIILLFFFTQRTFIQGISTTGMKG